MVLKLDLGGWLSEQSRMGWLLRPFMQGIHSSYLQPMLMSVIALRDKVRPACSHRDSHRTHFCTHCKCLCVDGFAGKIELHNGKKCTRRPCLCPRRQGDTFRVFMFISVLVA